ncbi:hypothetical protein EJ06DRAFT_543173 [Trichodelitschia bisporula]|uniref:FAR-17a/AIG1-like protein n=1 Tax=Trichodelitschia bisporula TaxID=703511 RepID=A0A6G1HWH5_9PEZI|nr:hypothetical protein EJ06DRAFT_543173 [Trichodelitschia bisporula]
MWSPAPIDPVRYSTSWALSPLAYASLRALISFYIFTSLIVILSIDGERSPSLARQHFSYFTNLTFWGLGFYHAFAALHTATYWLNGRPLLARWAGWLQQLHALFYTTVVTYPFIVTIVFWGLLFNGSFKDRFAAWSNVTEHALNSVFALLELILARAPSPPWLHALWLVIMLSLYLAVAFITFADQHFYVYGFLDDRKHSRGVVAGYIIGILVLAIVVFIVVKFVILGREKAVKKMGKGGGQLQTRGGTTAFMSVRADEVELRSFHHK